MRALVVIGSGDFGDALANGCNPSEPRLEFVEVARVVGARLHSADAPADAAARFVPLRRRKPTLASALGAALVAGKFDAIYVTGEDIGVWLALLLRARRWRGRLICLAHNLTPARIKRFRLIGPGIFAKVVTVSRAQADVLIEQCGFPADKVASVYNWIDDRFFDPAQAAPVEGDFFMACGAENRDYPTLGAAFDLLDGETIRVFGHGFWKTEQASGGAARKTTGVVQMPRVSYAALRDHYASARCTIVPLKDGMYAAGVTGLLEAMASSRPVIATETAGMAEYVERIDPALRVPPADAPAMAAAVRALAADPATRDAIGAENRAWTLRCCALDRYTAYIGSLMNGREDRTSPVLVPPSRRAMA